MKEAKQKLEAEIKKLDRELKDELPKVLTKALALGVLKENADYHAAKERQSFVHARLGHLRGRLAQLLLIDLSKIPTDKISYGSTVTLVDLDSDREIEYRLVSSEESDASKGLISTVSPIGKNLMGHLQGDEVTIRTPGGEKNYEIIKLKTLHEKE